MTQPHHRKLKNRGKNKTIVVSLWNGLATTMGQELLDVLDSDLIMAIKSLKVGDLQGDTNIVGEEAGDGEYYMWVEELQSNVLGKIESVSIREEDTLLIVRYQELLEMDFNPCLCNFKPNGYNE
ncbi:hypothetical protein C5167_026511 [Papaver somniferum]|nr:hypothetical protein C5167_026511 [Papaver somniferum]